MDFKFGKEPAHDELPPQSSDKGRQTGLLILLLVLVGGFGYLYFFTGMIRPQEPPQPPQPPPQVVKQPLPSRDAVPAAQPTPPSSASPAPPVTPGKQQPPATVGTAIVPVAPSQTPKPAAAKPADAVKPAAQLVKKEQPKEQPQPAVAKVEVKPVAVQSAPVEKKPVTKTTGPWTVVVDYYVVEEALAADMTRVKKTGLTPVMTSGPKRPATMHRLYVGECGSRAEGQLMLGKIQQIGGSGFLVQRGDAYELFAGSYAMQRGAEVEQQRLAAAGIKATIRKVQVPLASRKLTAGTFTDRKTAESAVKKLKDAAIGTPVLE